MFFIRHLFIIFLFLPFVVSAQNYPVQSTAILTSSFTGNLTDLSDPAQEKIKLLLTLNDFREPNLDVKVQVKIEGQGFAITSKPWFYAGSFNLIPGIPVALAGADFANLFNENYLDFNGLDRQAYTQRGVLPEGFYTITFFVFDQFAIPLKQVANAAFVNTWFSHCDPPLLNQPFCGSNLVVSVPQTVLFSWSPMHLSNPAIDPLQLEYQFQLFELRPNAQDANIVVQTTFPIYSEYISSTQLVYGITEPMLIEGLSYVWRVRAIDKRGRALFKNEGYSQVCTFTYGTVQQDLMATTPIVLTLDAAFKRSAKLRWDSIGIYKSYALTYRKTGNATYNWFEDITESAHQVITQLETKTEYEAKVRGITALGDTSPYSNTVTFTTAPPNPPLACGDMNVPLINEASPLLKNAQANIIVDVGQFEMLITHIEPLPTAGHYKGLGRIETPVLGSNINVYFNDITINEDLQVASGRVIGASDGMDQWIADNSMGSIKSGHDSAEHIVNIDITNANQISVDKANCKITVNGNSGAAPQTIQACVPTTLMDKNGNLYGVDESGNVVYVGKSGSGKGPLPASKNYMYTKYGKGIFYPDLYPTYGFDSLRYEGMKVHYKDVLDSSNTKKVAVAWQSVESGKMAVVRARVRLTNKTVAPSKLQFITGVGTIYKSSLENASSYQREGVYEFKLNVIGGGDGDVQELFIRDTVNKQYIGKLHVVSYKKVKKKVHLIPLEANGTNVSYSIDKAVIKAELNYIYKQAVTEWDVVLEPKLNIDTAYWDEDANNKLTISREALTPYSSEMRSINRFVRGQSYYNKNDYYILLAPLAPDSATADAIKGEMPRAKHIGYIFTSNTTQTELSHVIAHELAHGAFNLAHPFDEIPGISKGQTDNLLDYSTSTSSPNGGGQVGAYYQLCKYQWDLIHQSAYIIGLLEDTEDGLAMNAGDGAKILKALLQIKKANGANTSINLNTLGIPTNLYSRYLNIGGRMYTNIKVQKMASATSISPKNKMTAITSNNPFSTQISYGIDIDNGIKVFLASQIDRDNLLAFLTSTSAPNVVLFVNGFKPLEKTNDIQSFLGGAISHIMGLDNNSYYDSWSVLNQLYAGISMSNTNSVSTTDVAGYWAGIDDLFCLNMNVTSRYYADGSYPANTAKSTFGFNQRQMGGKACTADLISKLGTYSKTTPIDVVCHSMGWAYALGMIEELHTKGYKIGRVYCIAPENPSAGYVPNYVEEFWQYGADETKPLKEQDHIAPQLPVGNMGSNNSNAISARVLIPDDILNEYWQGPIPMHFFYCHTVANYSWIFTKKTIEPGYVKKR